MPCIHPPLASDPTPTRWLDGPVDLAGRAVHFVGIGGCGMSGLARLARAFGARCTGSDMHRSPTVEALEAEGVAVDLEQTADTLPPDCDLLVISAAVKSDHPQVIAARERGLPILKYAQLLGRLMIGRTGVAVAGTHGKSTTTAMLAHALIDAALDPSFIVGATCEQIGGGCRVGREDLLLAEACEYDRSFHNFHPTHAVVLNVEEDHLDVYGTLDAVIESFNVFARKLPADGSLLIGHESACRLQVAAGVACPVETLGFAPDADWTIAAERHNGAQRVTLRRAGAVRCRFDLRMPGEHMAYNAAAAAITAHRLGASWDAVGRALSTFRGLDRRMQRLGTMPAGARVVDDYGHHPTEIDATLRALRQHYLPAREAADPPDAESGRLICVFQPHQHSRTRFLLDQFAASFSDADVVIVPPIYFVRDSEADRRAVRSEHLVSKLADRGVDARHIADFDDIVAHLRQIARPDDLIVVMGAGPVWTIAHQLVATPEPR